MRFVIFVILNEKKKLSLQLKFWMNYVTVEWNFENDTFIYEMQNWAAPRWRRFPKSESRVGYYLNMLVPRYSYHANTSTRSQLFIFMAMATNSPISKFLIIFWNIHFIHFLDNLLYRLHKFFFKVWLLLEHSTRLDFCMFLHINIFEMQFRYLFFRPL